MTDSELRQAREEIADRIAVGHDRRRRRTLTIIAAAAVLVPIAAVVAYEALGSSGQSAPPTSPAPTSPGPTSAAPTGLDADEKAFLSGRAPTPELIEGVWRVDNGTTLLRFTADGAVQVDDRGRLFSNPGATGTYEIAGSLITIEVDEGSGPCAGQTLEMEASLPALGAMHVVHTAPGAGACSTENAPVDGAPPSTRRFWWALEQALPTNSDYLAGFAPSGAKGWKPQAAGAGRLVGTWLAEGGGNILELAAGMGYYVADESGAVVDQGDWRLRGRELTLISSASSTACDQGDVLVLGDLEAMDPGTSVFRGTVRENACDADWTPKAWIMLPSQNS